MGERNTSFRDFRSTALYSITHGLPVQEASTQSALVVIGIFTFILNDETIKTVYKVYTYGFRSQLLTPK